MLLACMFLFKNIYYSQNLIQNSSFENYTAPVNCSGGGGGFDNNTVFPANHVVDNWYRLNSPDYFINLCNGPNNDGTPINLFGNQNPKNGVAYPGFLLYGISYETKEYIYQQLNTPLQAGKIYCLSFYVSRADRITHAIHSIGAYFSNNVQTTGGLGYINATPQVLNQNGFITDTTSWSQIQGCFTANGGEQYITIGNFNSNANTDTLSVGCNDTLAGAYKYAYYYIDDITLIDQTTVGINELTVSPKINLSPNPNNGIMQLDYNLGNYSNAKFNLYDITGKLIQTKNIETNEGNLFINEQNLMNGVYFYTILVEEKNIKTDKIVIIK